MTLKEILNGVETTSPLNDVLAARQVAYITNDSRKVEPGSLFVAIKGEKADGHDFIKAVLDKKPAAIVAQHFPQEVDEAGTGTALITVEDTHEALGLMAANYYGNPSRELVLVGVTGTNGKTTIATLLYQMASKAGLKSGLLSTIANYIGEIEIPATHTTPDPLQLNSLLRRMADKGCKFAAMEVSSHAAHQRRIAGLKFAGGVFSNLTRDHLDYHKTAANYRDAKKLFFDKLPHDAFALVNIDDPNGEFMLQNCKARKLTYALRRTADFRGRIVERHFNSTLIELNGCQVETLFTGTFNIYNLTAVYGALIALGFDAEETLTNLSTLRPVAGRFQTIPAPGGYMAVVDYAHTPDALKNVLEALGELLPPGRKIITVVGAGGNRDQGKRPIMAQVAARLSHRLVLTADNPRFENPDHIIEQMAAGLDAEAQAKTLMITNRRQAIRTALSLAQQGDIVLVAGKGHENYQEIEGVKHHFDDVEEIKEFIKQH